MHTSSLINKLNYYTKLYDQGTPAISDKEWDDLYFELKEREEKTGFIYPNSPTQKINYEIISQLNKVEHNHPMLSLDKTKDINDIVDFFHGKEFICMFKMDGLTVSLTYEAGKLVKAETRGNGYIGEDITHNAKVIENIPQIIPTKDKLIVDGEIICRNDAFEKFKEKYKNPRNFAAGSIRLLSSEECAKRKLSFVAWDLINNSCSMKTKFENLFRCGFTVVPYKTGFDVKEVFKIMEDTDPDDPETFVYDHDVYPTDGYVFKFNDTKYGNSLGQTDHHFKNAIALKLYDEEYETRVKDIEWTMGRTGQLTPVLIYEDIEIDGTICNRASLHNISVMTQLMGGAYPGQKVYIYKANQIIPQVKSAQSNCPENVSLIQIPKKCPYCGHPIEIKKDIDSEVLYCINPKCEGKLNNILNHFFGKKGLDTKGLSKATFEKLMDWGWINNIEDVFNLKKYRAEWIKKSGFGILSVDKILQSIEEHRNVTLDAFISAIGIPLIGQTASKELVKHFKTYKDFRAAVDDKNYDFSSMDHFGPEMNNSLKTFNYTEADRISKILIFKEPIISSKIKNNILEGKTIVITGKLTTFKNRAELKESILQLGGKVSDSISGKTSVLINNDVNSTSAKNKAAKTRGIPILSEQDFIKQYIEK